MSPGADRRNSGYAVGMRALSALLALCFAGEALAAEPVWVPDFTPGAPAEFALAFMLQERVIETLGNRGHVAISGDAASPVLGPVRNCADSEDCPTAQLPRLPSRWAVVVRVERGEASLDGMVTLYERNGTAPVDRATIPIAGGNEQAFADAVADMLDRAVGDLGAAEPADVAEARSLIAGDWTPPDRPVDGEKPPKEPPPREPKEPVDPPDPEIKPTDPKVPKPPKGAEHLTLEQKLEKAGLDPRHIVGCKASFGEWDGPPLEWLFQQTPHAGRFTVEVRGGYGLGDVDRHADSRVYLDGSGEDWFQEGPRAGQRPRGALYLGYAPTTWVDLGAELGLQYGHRTLSTGLIEGGSTGAVLDAEVQAVQAWVRPQVRFYVVPLGIIKPFVYVGADVRAFDVYKITPGSVTFPAPPGGVVPGAGGGGGLMLDPGPIVGFFVEGGYTRHFGTRAAAAQLGDRPDDAPPPPNGTLATTQLTGGVQFRL
jgi:hypothetical protein